jgi:hypothetical protein
VTSSSTDRKQIRKFGIIALVFFGCLCALGIWNKKPVPIYLFGFLSFIGLSFIVIPLKAKPIYTGWLKLARLLGEFTTILVLILAYYLVITPTALIKRLFGGRPLPVGPDKKAQSYWVARTEPAQPKERFIKRY